ncbi:MAG: hypothetical protein R3302_02540 [Sulfurimonadaceae bacterium]|nr:hypothetical protein [Sulfurimonadaceae bacterium]
MAKRIIKSERIKTIIKNIAADFRFSNEMGDYALLFYKAETQGVINGKEIDDMIEYVTTGLEELKNNIQWRQEYLADNPGTDEMKMLDNLKTIEEEYVDLLEFLK